MAYSAQGSSGQPATGAAVAAAAALNKGAARASSDSRAIHEAATDSDADADADAHANADANDDDEMDADAATSNAAWWRPPFSVNWRRVSSSVTAIAGALSSRQQLKLQRVSGELATTRSTLDTERLESNCRQRADEERKVASEHLQGLEVLDPPSLEQMRGKLCQLADGRISELEGVVRQRDEQLRQLQSSTWGAWSEDQAVTAELERLQSELFQAHAINRGIAAELEEERRGAAEASAQAEGTQSDLRRRLEQRQTELGAAQSQVEQLTSALQASREEARTSAQALDALRATETQLREVLDDRDEQLRVSRAQVETLEEEMIMLRRGSSAAQLSARYDEQIELLKEQSASQAARDAEALRLAKWEAADARSEAEELREARRAAGPTISVSEANALAEQLRAAKAELEETRRAADDTEARLVAELRVAKRAAAVPSLKASQAQQQAQAQQQQQQSPVVAISPPSPPRTPPIGQDDGGAGGATTADDGVDISDSGLESELAAPTAALWSRPTGGGGGTLVPL